MTSVLIYAHDTPPPGEPGEQIRYDDNGQGERTLLSFNFVLVNSFLELTWYQCPEIQKHVSNKIDSDV